MAAGVTAANTAAGGGGYLCFMPVKTTIQLILVTRMFLAKLAVFWVFFSDPSSILTGVLGQALSSLLPVTVPAVPLPSLTIPVLASELVVDTLALVGVWRGSRLSILPAILFNGCLILVAGSGVVLTLLPLVLQPYQATTQIDAQEAPSSVCSYDPKCSSALRDIHRALVIILLNLVMVGEMVMVSALVRVAVDIGTSGRRRVSFSKKLTVHKEEDRDKAHQEAVENLHTSVRMYSDDTTVLLDNPNISITLEDSVMQPQARVRERDSWASVSENSIKFTFDKENFE